MRTVLFAAILLAVVSVPAAYATTLQLVTENGNVFSIDFDEILFLWEMQNPSNQTLAIAILQQQIANLTAGIIPTTNSTEIDDLQDRINELQEQLNTNSTDIGTAVTLLENEIEMLREQLNSNSTATDVEIERLENLIQDAQDTIDSLTTDLENLEQDGVGAGALGSSGRLMGIQTNGVLAYGNHSSDDNLGIAVQPFPFTFPAGSFDWATLIKDSDSYDEYEIPSFRAEYEADQRNGALIHTRQITSPFDYFKVTDLPSNTAWSINSGEDVVYAGVTDNAGNILFKRIPNEGVTIARDDVSEQRSPDMRIVDMGSLHDTITVAEYATVNDMLVTYEGRCFRDKELISPDDTVYPLGTSGCYAKTYQIDAAGKQVNGDWTFVFRPYSASASTFANWTLNVNHGDTGLVNSINDTGDMYSVEVSTPYSGTYGLQLMEAHGITHSSYTNNQLDATRVIFPNETYDTDAGPDRGAPLHVYSIELHDPSTIVSPSANVEYLVTFSKPVDSSTVDSGDFAHLRQDPSSYMLTGPSIDVWHESEQPTPSTGRVYASMSYYNSITYAKLVLNASSPDSRFVDEFQVNLTAPDGTNMVIADGSQARLNGAGGMHEFYLGEMIGKRASGYWTLSVIDRSNDDDPTSPGTNDPDGTIDFWTLEIESNPRHGTVGTVRADGTGGDKYIVPVSGLSASYDGHSLWLHGDNDIDAYGEMISPRNELALEQHEHYDRQTPSSPSIPYVRYITVADSDHDSVTFDVTFSSPVSGVNATDFVVLVNGVPETNGPQELEYTSVVDTAVSQAYTTNTTDTVTIYEDGAERVNVVTLGVDITHERVGNLEIDLVLSNGTAVTVYDNPGSSDGGYDTSLVTTFALNNTDVPLNGDWSLQVRDTFRTRIGTINSWSLDFSYEDTPAHAELPQVEADKGEVYTWDDLSGPHTLRVYPDALVTLHCNGAFFDPIHHETQCFPSADDVIYAANAYVRYPVTVQVDISNVRASEHDDCGSPLRFHYLTGTYAPGEALFVPVGPGMAVLCLNIEGSETIVHLEDIVEQIQILPLRAHGVSSGNVTFVDMAALSQAATILPSNDPVEINVSFSASGKSESIRNTYFNQFNVLGPDGEILYGCQIITRFAVSVHYPPTGVLLLPGRYDSGGRYIPCPSDGPWYEWSQGIKGTWSRGIYEALQQFSTEYEVKLVIMKNGALYDEVHFPITSLEPLDPIPIWTTPYYTGLWNDPLLVELIDGDTVLGGISSGTNNFQAYGVESRQSSMRTSWAEQFSHTFTIDGNAGDHIEIRASNRIIFDFPVPLGHYHRYNVDAEYDRFDPLPRVNYWDNDGIHVNINSGNVIIVQSPN